jgi:hypothetical protein
MFIAVVWVLHVAKLLSPIPEHVVADAHAEPGSQSQPERFDSSVFSAEDLVAIPKIMHYHCGTHTDIPWLQGDILQKLHCLEESLFTSSKIEVCSKWASNKSENGESSKTDRPIHKRLRHRWEIHCLSHRGCGIDRGDAK